MFKPYIKLDKITDISLDLLNQNGFTALILDVDNTLSTHHGQHLTTGLSEWLNTMKNAGIKLIILSNSTNKRVEPFAEKIGLEYISMGLKPLPFGYFKAIKKMAVKKKNVAIVGDQLFTDAFGAHLSGVKSIILNPILKETMLRFRIKRKLESYLYKLYRF